MNYLRILPPFKRNFTEIDFCLFSDLKKNKFWCFVNSLTSKKWDILQELNNANVETHNVGSLCLKTSAIFLKLSVPSSFEGVVFNENSLYQ